MAYSNNLSEGIIFKLENVAKDFYYAVYFSFSRIFSSANLDEGFVIVSFPKSGRTWLRTTLAKYIELYYSVPFNVELDNLPENIPKIKFTHIVHSIRNAKAKGIVVLLRDPRDVLVSYYYERTQRPLKSRKKFKGTISEFARSRWGIRRIVHFLNKLVIYESNMKKSNQKILYLTYESLKRNQEKEMTKLLKFLGLPTDRKILLKAINFSSFKRMQKMEKKGVFDSWRLSHLNKNNINSFKMRKGKIGGYVDELTPEEIRYVNNYISRHLDKRIYRRIYKASNYSIGH